ncbi:sulfide-dependent adenosine diphosphate thiazole synthase [Desulfothermobacter acidiphilus]|uniref:sulfide-dependent adenosine diphosphate thiazole synthase n=1 Tax=Desulfothermobacter acidiphilus TaxID=1938353 RepID=UPI003F88607A
MAGRAIDERLVSRAIVKTYFEELLQMLEFDVAVVGAGPSGLTAAYYLAQGGLRTVVFERRLSVGGGMWGGAMMFNYLVFQEDARPLFETMGVRYQEFQPGYYVAQAVEAVAAFTLNACRAGARIMNLISVEDLVLRDNRVSGLVLNWTAVDMAGMHVDPLAVHCPYIIDATGHDAEVVRILTHKNQVALQVSGGQVRGEKSLWSDRGEQQTLDYSGEVFPGLYVVGMAAIAVAGGHRMGPIFGGMVLSGKKVAEMIIEDYRRRRS